MIVYSSLIMMCCVLTATFTGVPFPRNFLQCARSILKRLFRVYAHVYHEHIDDVIRLKEEIHLNTSFKHFVLFIKEFSLVDAKELAPLEDFIERIVIGQ